MIDEIDENEFDRVCQILDTAFPKTEKRLYAAQKALLSHPNYRLIPWRKTKGGEILAFLAVWEFDAFRFVEHFAVDGELRGQGVGQNMLKEYLASDQQNRPVVLEVEPPETEIARRRIGFYQRIGFLLNEYPYVQPPLQEGQDPIPLMVMSYPSLLSQENFNQVQSQLYQTVYQVSSNC